MSSSTSPIVPCLCAVSLLSALSLAAQEAEDHLRRELRLAPLGASTVWLTEDEVELRERLTELPRQKDRLRQLERQIDERRRNNLAQWNALAQTRAAIKRAADNLSSSDPAVRRLKQRLESLQKVAVDPNEFGGHENVRPLLIELATIRNEMLLSTNYLRRKAGGLPHEYDELAQRAADPLRRLGSGHRLGPARDYAPDVRRLGEFDELLAQSMPPLFMQSSLPRVAAVVNETAPVTFTWSDSSGPVLLTTSAAQTCRITPLLGKGEPGGAGEVETIAVSGRKLTVTKVVIPYIQFSAARLTEVEAFILPPEAEDLGSRIGPDAFRPSGYLATPRLDALVLQIEEHAE